MNAIIGLSGEDYSTGKIFFVSSIWPIVFACGVYLYLKEKEDTRKRRKRALEIANAIQEARKKNFYDTLEHESNNADHWSNADRYF